jgi:SAM-dependent methyltransferase
VSDPGGIVQEGFDALGERYLVWQLEAEEDPRRPYLERFMNELPGGARVLDLGCGPGVPTTQLLAEHFDLTGVDFSAAQIELARSRVPEARFIEANLSKANLSQAMHVLAGGTYVDRLSRPNSRLAKLLQSGGTDEKIFDEFYFAALSRPPAGDEVQELKAILAQRELRSVQIGSLPPLFLVLFFADAPALLLYQKFN